MPDVQDAPAGPVLSKAEVLALAVRLNAWPHIVQSVLDSPEVTALLDAARAEEREKVRGWLLNLADAGRWESVRRALWSASAAQWVSEQVPDLLAALAAETAARGAGRPSPR